MGCTERRVAQVIAIVDYGAGNLRSVCLAFSRIGVSAVVTDDPQEILRAAGVVLPGVGAFADAMTSLTNRGLVPALRRYAACGRPFLGICLGMQALFDRSEEGTGTPGLGLIPGTVRRLPDVGLKVPHMGWNSLAFPRAHPLTAGLPDEPYVYFVHSYACFAQEDADVLAVTEYGVPFHAAMARGNVMGVQFHPEKSGTVGEQMLRRFAAMTADGEGAPACM